MILPLTARLVAAPDRAWLRLKAAHEAGEILPSPMGHAAAVAALSVIGSTIGAALARGATVAHVVVVMLLAIAGYVGAIAIAIDVAPRWIPVSDDARPHLGRWAGAAMVPLAASGVLHVVPDVGLGLVWPLLGAIASVHTARIGAGALLGLSGPARTTAATTLVGVGLVPIVLAALVRVLVLRR